MATIESEENSEMAAQKAMFHGGDASTTMLRLPGGVLASEPS
jgi:hypothetical protein